MRGNHPARERLYRIIEPGAVPATGKGCTVVAESELAPALRVALGRWTHVTVEKYGEGRP